MKDRETGRSRGFGFVVGSWTYDQDGLSYSQTYAAQEDAEKAIEAMNSTDMDGRTIRVSIVVGLSSSTLMSQVNMANSRGSGGGGGGGGYGGGNYGSGCQSSLGIGKTSDN